MKTIFACEWLRDFEHSLPKKWIPQLRSWTLFCELNPERQMSICLTVAHFWKGRAHRKKGEYELAFKEIECAREQAQKSHEDASLHCSHSDPRELAIVPEGMRKEALGCSAMQRPLSRIPTITSHGAISSRHEAELYAAQREYAKASNISTALSRFIPQEIPIIETSHGHW